MEQRECIDCGEVKAIGEYAKQRAPESRGEAREDDGLNLYCRRCGKRRSARRDYHKAKQAYIDRAKRWDEENPEKRKRIARTHARRRGWDKLGVTPDDVRSLLERAGGKCEICKVEFDDETPWCLDHCHDSGEVRGIICKACNLGLGYFRDNQENLMSAIKYLIDFGS